MATANDAMEPASPAPAIPDNSEKPAENDLNTTSTIPLPDSTAATHSREPNLADQTVSSSSHAPSLSNVQSNENNRNANENERPDQTRQSKVKNALASIVSYITEQWFLVALGLLVLIASQVQVPAAGQHLKETVITYLCVAIIFFISGCTLPTRVLLQNYSRWKLHVFVQVQCFLITSATTFAIVSACATNRDFLDPWLLIGLIFMGCVPTTISSNVVMTRRADGNSPLTVVESTVGNFIGPFVTPLLVTLYTSTGAWYTQVLPPDRGSFGEIYRRVFKQLGLSLFLPLFVGQVVQNVFPKPTRKVFVDWKLSKISSFALLLIIWQTFDQAFETRTFQSMKTSNAVFIIFISMALFVVWLSICVATSFWWLSPEDTTSVAYTVPAKGPALGVPLVVVLYIGVSRTNESKIQIPVVIFQAFQILFGSLLTTAFRHWILRGKHGQPGSRDAV